MQWCWEGVLVAADGEGGLGRRRERKALGVTEAAQHTLANNGMLHCKPCELLRTIVMSDSCSR